MKLIVFLITILTAFSAAQATERLSATVGAEVWASPRQAETFLQHEGVGQLVRALLQAPESRLQLRYPDNEWGEIWGEELRTWLISLGISSDRLDLLNDFENLDGVQIVLDDGLTHEQRIDLSEPPSAAISDALMAPEEPIDLPPTNGDAPLMPTVTVEPKEAISQELP